MKIKILCFAFIGMIFSVNAAQQKGAVFCNSLFLIRSDVVNANTSRCGIQDTITSGTLSFAGNFERKSSRADFFVDDWKLRMNSLNHQYGVYLRGDFQHFALSSELKSFENGFQLRSQANTYFMDSLLVFGGGLEKGHGKLFDVDWNFLKTGNWVDSISGVWKSDWKGYFFVLGSKWNAHSLNFSFTLRDSKRISAKTHYGIEDSSAFQKIQGEYVYRGKDIQWKILTNAWNLEALIVGVRRENEDVKRFLYLPVRAHGKNLAFTLNAGNFTGGLSFLQIHLKVPKRLNRFEETFAPNRVLDASLLQALSFAFFQRNYRWFGSANGSLVTTNFKWDFPHAFSRWKIIPQISLQPFYGNFEFEITQKIESVKLFGQNSSNVEYNGSGYAAGTVISLGNRFSFLPFGLNLDFLVNQVIPIFSDLENEKKESVSEELKDSGSNQNFRYLKSGLHLSLAISWSL